MRLRVEDRRRLCEDLLRMGVWLAEIEPDPEPEAAEVVVTADEVGRIPAARCTFGKATDCRRRIANARPTIAHLHEQLDSTPNHENLTHLRNVKIFDFR